MNLLCRDKNYCSRIVVALFIYLKILKMGPIILFTHLKIILLQCFQFSISAKISSIQTNSIYIFLVFISHSLSIRLDCAFCTYAFSLFFFQRMNCKIIWIYCARDKNYCSCTLAALFIYCSSTIYVFKNIKTGSHGTIHTFKNYFTTVFSVFNFSKNNFNPNGPLVSV